MRCAPCTGTIQLPARIGPGWLTDADGQLGGRMDAQVAVRTRNRVAAHRGGFGSVSSHRRVRKHPWGRVGLGFLVVFAGLLVASAVIVNLEHLKFQPVLSGSMRPGVQPGDLAIVRPVQTDRLRVGEVIAYLPPGQSTPVIHRIISVTPAGIVTKGDANSVADPWGRVKPQSSTVARLVAVVPKVGFVTDVRRQLLVGSGVIVLVALMLALWSRSRKADNATASTDAAEPQPAEPFHAHNQ